MGRYVYWLALACALASPAAVAGDGARYLSCPAPAVDDGSRYTVSDEEEPGFLQLPFGPCLRLGATVSASAGSLFYNDIFDREADRSNGSTVASSGSLDVSTRQRLDAFDLSTNVTFESSGSGLLLSRATINAGPFAVGRRSSFFDYWEPTNFLYTDLVPSKYPVVAAYTVRLAPNVRLSVSAESPRTRFVVVDGYGSQSLPDVVARLRIKTAFATIQASAAWRRVRFAPTWTGMPAAGDFDDDEDGDGDGPSPGASPAVAGRLAATGWALQLAATIPLPVLGSGDELVFEADYARNAPGYLGVSNPDDAVGYTMPSSFTARQAELSRGASASVMLTHHWSTQWRSSAFVTYMTLRFDQPRLPQLRVVRSAVNLVWSPIQDLDVGIETNRIQALVPRGSAFQEDLPSRDQWTFQGSVKRSF
ncbi:porin [Chelatococcus reniformis]|uniref:Porin n=1 Tax=Chelatococcus reniformis TaxID=1494448 RepID=A0A916XLK7_9HYPH|nr:porin [Chelatococcus reniformis]GGC81618.1 hypothetical protein GCM10010994_44490 [Chelatococcus reniformis]